MNRIEDDLLGHTLNVMALAREVARARGSEEQARALTPVVDGLKAAAASQPPASPLGNFQDLLAAVQAVPLGGTAPGAEERHQAVEAMASGGMAEVDIARHLGLSQDEVHLILNLARRQPTLGGTQ